MPRVKIYHTEEEKRIANLNNVKRWYAKNHAKKWDPNRVSAYSTEYHKLYYLKQKEKKLKEKEERLAYEKELDTLMEEVDRCLANP